MDFLFTGAMSRLLDEQTQKTENISAQQLMGQAALASAYQLQIDGLLPKAQTLLDPSSGHTHPTLTHKAPTVAILCGRGNNGGDGLALALHLTQMLPIQCKIFLDGNEKQLENHQFPLMKTDDGNFYLNLCRKSCLHIRPLSEFASWQPATLLVIDALLGSGSRPPLQGLFLEVVQDIQRRKKEMPVQDLQVVSLDLPTGLGDENAHEMQNFMPADLVYCLGVLKAAVAYSPHFPPHKVRLLPMGFPLHLVQHLAFTHHLPRQIGFCLDLSLWRKQEHQHKYQAGAATIVGGNSGMEGALLLALRSFFASGGGIAWGITSTETAREVLLSAEPSGMYVALDSLSTLDGQGPESMAPPLLAGLGKGMAYLLGPGLALGDDPIAQQNFYLLLELIKSARAHKAQIKKFFPFVIVDAGALPWTKQIIAILGPENILLTPHRGELAQLGFTFHGGVVEAQHLHQWVQQLGVWVLIKDAISFLMGPAPQDFYVWNYPLSHLSVAGSGDVLGGILLSLCSRGPYPVPVLVSAALSLHHWAARSVAPHPMASNLIAGIRYVLDEGPH